MFVDGASRFASGYELLALHSVPVTQQLSDAMNATMVDVSHVSHRVQAKLAGNSMHGSCVGVMLFAIFFVKHVESM